MSISTIELRELDQSSTSDGLNNGQFEVQLSNPITIKNQETIGISKVFIDTATNNRIKIEEDIDASLSFIPYYHNFNESKNSSTLRKYYTTANPQVQPDGLNYFPTIYESGAGTMSLLKSIKWFMGGKAGRFMFIGDPTFKFEYFDSAGVRQVWVSKHKRHLKNQWRNIGDENDVNIIFQTAKGFNPIPSGSKSLLDEYADANIDFDRSIGSIEQEQITEGRFEPIVFTKKIKIPKSAEDGYTTNQIARMITDQLSQLSTSGDFNTDVKSNGFILTTTTNINTFKEEFYPTNQEAVFYCSNRLAVNPQGTLNANGNEQVFGSEVPFNVSKINATNLFVGASQIALEFDDGSSDSDGTARFKWSATYSPHTNSSGQPVNSFYGRGSGTDGFISNKMGGIIFMDLEPASFWFDTLKFDRSILGVKTFTKVSGYPLSNGDGRHAVGGATPIQNPYMPSINFLEGVNITGGFCGLDSIVDKTSSEGLNFQVPTYSASGSTMKLFDAQSSTTIPIYSAETFVEGIADTGYFLIEINAISNNDYVYSDNKINGTKKIGAIVSRYYNTPSYTMGGIETSLSWTNKGEDMIIKTFKVRILNPDGTPVSQNIGEDNTIFLSHTQSPSIQEGK